MGTSAYFAVKKKNGEWRCATCYHDGSKSYCSPILTHFYNTYEKALKLVSEDFDSLRESIYATHAPVDDPFEREFPEDFFNSGDLDRSVGTCSIFIFEDNGWRYEDRPSEKFKEYYEKTFLYPEDYEVPDTYIEIIKNGRKYGFSVISKDQEPITINEISSNLRLVVEKADQFMDAKRRIDDICDKLNIEVTFSHKG